jgi:L-seryl-tRNA(Ser) seleniumtransferase
MTKNSTLRTIPAVEKVLQALGPVDLPRPVIVAVVRRELAALREQRTARTFDSVLEGIRASLDRLRTSRIQPVINGTGILIHTNLGRAPLGQAVLATLSNIAANYNNLELDLSTGERGNRAAYLEHNLALLCGAEAATVANNCAAALLLILRHFTAGARKEVLISRGELIQIGGGFRIPEILAASGARLREIGTTNMTVLKDYAKAITAETALILKVHRSNFSMNGFVESPATSELAALAQQKKLPLVEDLGSGSVLATERLAPVEHEPTPAETLKAGVHLVCCSGDKLFGGVQAGIIAGRARLIAALKREPFFRALRCDKLILSALQTTVDLYLRGGEANIRLLELMRASQDELRVRAEKVLAALADLPLTAGIGESQAQIGGGSLPGSVIPSIRLELVPRNVGLAAFAAKLRSGSPPVIGAISGGRYRLDLRTVFANQDQPLVQAIRLALGSASAPGILEVSEGQRFDRTPAQ